MQKKKRIVLVAVILFICLFITTGCFQDETHTATGAMWYVEDKEPTDNYIANVGDMYLDKTTNNLYQKKEDGWQQVGNLSSKEESTMPSIEVSDDGYWVIDGEKTTHKAIGENGKNGQDGKDGKDGKDGVNGTTPSIKIGENGHWYINGKDTGLTAIGKDGKDGVDGKDGANGTNGTDGKDGADGLDGTNTYIGYDDYIWNTTERTSFKVSKEKEDNLLEYTLGIQDTMSLYFKNGYLDLSDKTVALMSYYMSNAKLTKYSETKITEISVYTNKAGKLSIGTAKVLDIVNARTNGTTYSVDTKEYDVTKGLNTITVDINVSEDETIILGGNNSVGLFYATGIPNDDEEGVFTYIDNEKHDYIISSTNNIKDKLAIKVNGYHHSEPQAVFPNILTQFPDSTVSTMAEYQYQGGNPYTYVNKTYYAGKTITKIGVPVKTVTAVDDKQFFTICTIDQSKAGSGNGECNESYKIYLPKEELESTTVNKWIHVDVTDLNIKVAADETLGFSASGDTVVLGYQNKGTTYQTYYFYSKTGVSCVSTSGILIDIYYRNTITNEKKLEVLKTKEESAMTSSEISSEVVSVTQKHLLNSSAKATDITQTARLANYAETAENPNTSTSLIKIITIIVAIITCAIVYKAISFIKINKYNE